MFMSLWVSNTVKWSFLFVTNVFVTQKWRWSYQELKVCVHFNDGKSSCMCLLTLNAILDIRGSLSLSNVALFFLIRFVTFFSAIFTFISRRHRGAPFGLTFYIDGMQDIRLSSCCEYKHKPGKILGGRNGHFQFVLVEGAAPCYRCQVASGVRSKHRSSQGDEDSERLKTFLTDVS